VTLDPALAGALGEAQVVRTIFEGLTNLHPRTVEPLAGVATRYQVTPDGMRFKLFLRGHSAPRGIALPGVRASNNPALWTDGLPVTAHDFVYAWRRVVDPATAAMYAYLLNCVQHAKGITSGKLALAKLGVRAADDFCLQVDLEEPTPFFLQMLSWVTFFPVPRQALEHNEASWTNFMVTNGAFTLAENRSRDRIIVAKNQRYYDARSVLLDNVSFLLTQEAVAGFHNVTCSMGTNLIPLRNPITEA
jgi:oligopeptide transport system substrate-binding protein